MLVAGAANFFLWLPFLVYPSLIQRVAERATVFSMIFPWGMFKDCTLYHFAGLALRYLLLCEEEGPLPYRVAAAFCKVGGLR